MDRDRPRRNARHTPIRGTAFWSGHITVAATHDPKLEIGKVYWLESKETGLMRPEFRRRARVTSATQEYGTGAITYGFVEVPPKPEWSQSLHDEPVGTITVPRL